MNKQTSNSLEQRDLYIDLYEKYNKVLTQNQKQIFHLYFIEDLSLAEISEITATTRSGVHDTLTKAKKKLEKFI